MFELVTGKPPFYTQSLNSLIEMILEKQIPDVPGVSSDFNKLTLLLLEKDPVKRITFEEIKKHPFFDGFSLESNVPAAQPQFDLYLTSRGINP